MLAFNNCTSLANLAVPSSIVLVDEKAFSGCSNLASFTFCDTIPGKLPEISDSDFDDCHNLVDVVMPVQ